MSQLLISLLSDAGFSLCPLTSSQSIVFCISKNPQCKASSLSSLVDALPTDQFKSFVQELKHLHLNKELYYALASPLLYLKSNSLVILDTCILQLLLNIHDIQNTLIQCVIASLVQEEFSSYIPTLLNDTIQLPPSSVSQTTLQNVTSLPPPPSFLSLPNLGESIINSLKLVEKFENAEQTLHLIFSIIPLVKSSLSCKLLEVIPDISFSFPDYMSDIRSRVIQLLGETQDNDLVSSLLHVLTFVPPTGPEDLENTINKIFLLFNSCSIEAIPSITRFFLELLIRNPSKELILKLRLQLVQQNIDPQTSKGVFQLLLSEIETAISVSSELATLWIDLLMITSSQPLFMLDFWVVCFVLQTKSPSQWSTVGHPNLFKDLIPIIPNAILSDPAVVTCQFRLFKNLFFSTVSPSNHTDFQFTVLISFWKACCKLETFPVQMCQHLISTVATLINTQQRQHLRLGLILLKEMSEYSIEKCVLFAPFFESFFNTLEKLPSSARTALIPILVKISLVESGPMMESLTRLMQKSLIQPVAQKNRLGIQLAVSFAIGLSHNGSHQRSTGYFNCAINSAFKFEWVFGFLLDELASQRDHFPKSFVAALFAWIYAYIRSILVVLPADFTISELPDLNDTYWFSGESAKKSIPLWISNSSQSSSHIRQGLINGGEKENQVYVQDLTYSSGDSLENYQIRTYNKSPTPLIISKCIAFLVQIAQKYPEMRFTSRKNQEIQGTYGTMNKSKQYLTTLSILSSLAECACSMPSLKEINENSHKKGNAEMSTVHIISIISCISILGSFISLIDCFPDSVANTLYSKCRQVAFSLVLLQKIIIHSNPSTSLPSLEGKRFYLKTWLKIFSSSSVFHPHWVTIMPQLSKENENNDEINQDDNEDDDEMISENDSIANISTDKLLLSNAISLCYIYDSLPNFQSILSGLVKKKSICHSDPFTFVLLQISFSLLTNEIACISSQSQDFQRYPKIFSCLNSHLSSLFPWSFYSSWKSFLFSKETAKSVLENPTVLISPFYNKKTLLTHFTDSLFSRGCRRWDVIAHPPDRYLAQYFSRQLSLPAIQCFQSLILKLDQYFPSKDLSQMRDLAFSQNFQKSQSPPSPSRKSSQRHANENTLSTPSLRTIRSIPDFQNPNLEFIFSQAPRPTRRKSNSPVCGHLMLSQSFDDSFDEISDAPSKSTSPTIPTHPDNLSSPQLSIPIVQLILGCVNLLCEITPFQQPKESPLILFTQEFSLQQLPRVYFRCFQIFSPLIFQPPQISFEASSILSHIFAPALLAPILFPAVTFCSGSQLKLDLRPATLEYNTVNFLPYQSRLSDSFILLLKHYSKHQSLFTEKDLRSVVPLLFDRFYKLTPNVNKPAFLSTVLKMTFSSSHSEQDDEQTQALPKNIFHSLVLPTILRVPDAIVSCAKDLDLVEENPLLKNRSFLFNNIVFHIIAQYLAISHECLESNQKLILKACLKLFPVLRTEIVPLLNSIFNRYTSIRLRMKNSINNILKIGRNLVKIINHAKKNMVKSLLVLVPSIVRERDRLLWTIQQYFGESSEITFQYLRNKDVDNSELSSQLFSQEENDDVIDDLEDDDEE